MQASRLSIRDFGYPEENPLHYGVINSQGQARQRGKGSYRSSSSSFDDEYGEDARGTRHGDESSEEEVAQKAVALYSFEPENDNELRLVENQIVLISYRYGQGWLVAHDPSTNETGLIPEEYVELYDEDEEEEEGREADNDNDNDKSNKYNDDDDQSRRGPSGTKEEPRPFLPELLQDHTVEGNESDWVDEEEDI